MSIIIPPTTGERAAMGGYVPQYDEFSRRVYDHILQGDLVEIRVADAEENVGKLDDICYVTTKDVFAYQMKWSITDSEFTYKDFLDLIPDVVDGWRKLVLLYPDKDVHTFLITNKVAKTGNVVKDNKGKEIGKFPEYKDKVIDRLMRGVEIGIKWTDALAKLKEVSTLKDSEWRQFWSNFTFNTEYEVEEVRVEHSGIDKRQEDLISLFRYIQQIVADKSRNAVYSAQQIINALGWQNRLTTKFNHSLTVPMASYEPIEKATDELNAQLNNKTKGYIFLEGSPGSGKSTILTQWANSIPNKTIRYYTFDFTNPSSSRNNDWHRGDSTSFLFDMVLMMENEFDSHGRTLPFEDDMQLKKRFYELLAIIGKSAVDTGLPTIIIVDGLDHISREYTECSHTLIKVLPSIVDLPDGVIFILGSQYFDKLPLNKSLIAEYKTGKSTIKMPPFSEQEVGELTKKILGEDNAPLSLIEKCYNKSQGHPLYLRYILKYLEENMDANIDEIVAYSGDVEVYYDSLLTEDVVNDAELKHLLALMSRLNGEILLDFVDEWNIPEQTKIDFHKSLLHLFEYNKESRTLRFFHNSFRQYLLNRTSASSITGDYDERNNFKYYKELAEYIDKSNVSSKWEEGYYLYYAHEYNTFVARLTPEVLTRQMHDFRPVWHVVRDVNRGLEIGKEEKNPYLIVRYLLMKSQIGQMSQQDYDGLNIVPELLKVGRADLAKFLIHSGGELHCNQQFALGLALDFMAVDDITEANILLDMSYPSFLMEDPKERSQDFNHVNAMSELAEKWIETAAYLIPKEKIVEHYHRFADYIRSYSEYHSENYDDDVFYCNALVAYTDSLVNQHRFDELESLLSSLDISRKYVSYIIFRVYGMSIKEMLASDFGNDEKNSYFDKLVKYCNPESSRQNLNVALIAYKLGKENSIIRQYLSQVDWDKLDDYHMSSIEDGFDRLRERILFVDLSSALGDRCNLSELIPDNEKDVDSPLLNSYVRMVLHLAKLKGEARERKANSAELLSLAKHYLSFCDGIPFNSHNRYSYAIIQQRSDFYKYLASVVSHFDSRTQNAFLSVVAEYFESKGCKASSKAKRTLVTELYNIGADKGNCSALLQKIEANMLDRQDVDGIASELLGQGKAWMEFGDVGRAFELFHKMIDETFGVGYRKDYQPSTFVEWIVEANKAMPEQATERMKWMAQRIRHIYDSAENEAGSDATYAMMKEALRINIGYGVRFAEFMLDRELTSYLDAFSVLLRNLLDKISTEDEYFAILHLYADLYLFTSSVDNSPSLLRKVISVGKIVCARKIDLIKGYLIKSVNINCSNDHKSELIDVINGVEPAEETHSANKNDVAIAESLKALEIGNKRLAWDKAMEAVKESSSSGWIRFYDGGTRINACRMLQKVDKDRGRDYTIKLFVDDIITGGAYGASRCLDEILPLLTDNIDKDKLFSEESGYMNRILRENAVCYDDTPSFVQNDMSVIDVIIDWCIYLVSLPISSIVEKAMIQLTCLVDGGHTEIIDRLPSERKKLELGMYLVEINSDSLGNICSVAENNVFNDNYQLRIYARRILDTLGVQYQHVLHRRLPSFYNLILPSSTGFIGGEFGHLNLDDVNAVMHFADFIISYLSYITGYEKNFLTLRGYLLLSKLHEKEEWSDEGEERLNQHLDKIYLRYQYAQRRASFATDAMMEVASELLDGGEIGGRYDDSVFMTYDFANIKVETIEKPSFIQRIADNDTWIMTHGWERKPEECVRLKSAIKQYNGGFVIGEYTRLIKPDDYRFTEEYLAIMSESKEKVDKREFFGSEPFQKEVASYFDDDIEYGSRSAVVREGYFTLFSLKEKWLAFNPTIAKSLGWHHSTKGMFAWENSEGRIMAQSFYWRSGNVQYVGRTDTEMGEGWIVVVNDTALSLLQNNGYVYFHQLVQRQTEFGENRLHPTYYYVVKEIQKH